jgi:rare lipoprotein A
MKTHPSAHGVRALTLRHDARRRRAAAAALLAAGALALVAQPADAQTAAGKRLVPEANPTLDRSGVARTGKASYYADFFGGRKMANGERFRLDGDNAASRTLPFGTVVRVTNLENGRSEVVVIKDRGPYIDGRIVDVSPGTAKKLAMLDDGVVRVEVTPLAVPQADGTIVRGGAGTDVAHAQ